MQNARTTPPPLPGQGPTPVPKKHSLWWRAVIGLALIGLMAGGGALLMHASIDQAEETVQQPGTSRHELLGEVKSWGYQLQGLDVAAAARSGFDLIVVDETIEPRREARRRADSLKALKRKPDGARRLVIAYLSIGEAEEYRDYWRKNWVALGPVPPARQVSGSSAAAPAPPRDVYLPGGQAVAAPVAKSAGAVRPLRLPGPSAPVWLGEENPDWRGNFYVRYWDESWQTLMLGNETAALDRIIGAGFDGVYLDRADAYHHWERERPGAKAEMETLIERISARARELSPGFVVVLQNAEELLGHARVRKAIDAVAKEDLFYGVPGPEQLNTDADVTSSLRYLKKARSAGLPVLVVEYLSNEALVAQARRRIQAQDFVPYFAPRALDRLQQD